MAPSSARRDHLTIGNDPACEFAVLCEAELYDAICKPLLARERESRDELPYKLDKPQPFPEADDLERRWQVDGKWYEPRK